MAEMYKQLGLDWCENNFEVLGITLNKPFDNIWTLNLDEKLVKIGKLLNSWRGKCRTICGRITVVKTLAMSKVIHIFTRVPNPPNEYILKIHIIIFSFIWKDGPDRIKRSIITKNYTEAGLKMVETLIFIKALKVPWLRSYFQSENKWKYFKINI